MNTAAAATKSGGQPSVPNATAAAAVGASSSAPASSDAAMQQHNPHPPGSASHGHYKAGWNHAVHGHKKGDRKHKAHTQGVVHGLMWKRRHQHQHKGK